MPTVALRLIPATAPATVRAGFLPGSDVAAWLEEMARHPEARCFIVPTTVEEAEAGGLVLIPATNQVPVFGPRVVPCAVEYDRVVVPATTRLDPALTADEARRLLGYAWYFFHPSLGLVGFEESDAIAPESLIIPPLLTEISWHHALPGEPSAPSLTRVELRLPDEEPELFGGAAQEIGSRSPRDLQKNAPSLERLRDFLLGGVSRVGLPLLSTLGALARWFGRGARPSTAGHAQDSGSTQSTRRGSMDRVGDWSAAQFEKLQQYRERELSRLLQLLETNPEAGLRYALPLADGGQASRGQAPPGWHLFERHPSFTSSRGGGPADVWNVSPHTQWRLQQQYRQLANRELAASRFDRAAYIFAELLGDWHAAAGALARGGRHQEAARIYLARLQNPSLAAQCLEDGGLLTEALLLYGQLSQHEKCGDLLRVLGRERDAVASYREALKGTQDRLHDARILFEKLQQHDLALRVLASGYTRSSQARPCLERHFEYLDHIHATEAAVALARSLHDPSCQLADPVEMTEALRSIHQAQRHPEVRSRLAVVATRIIGEALAAGTAKSGPLLTALPKFAPSDLLLKRDCRRFDDVRSRDRCRNRRGKTRGPTGEANPDRPPIGVIALPQDGTEWRHLISEGTQWLAVGWNAKSHQDVWVLGEADRIIGRRTSISGLFHPTGLRPVLLPTSEAVWLPCSRIDLPPRYGEARKADFASGPNTTDMMIDRLNWLPSGVLAVCPARYGGFWIAHRNFASATRDLSFHDHCGKLFRTHALSWDSELPEGPVHLAVHGDSVLLGEGSHLIHIVNGSIVDQSACRSEILHLRATQPPQPPAFLALTSTEVVLVAPGADRTLVTSSLVNAQDDDEPPMGCLLADGRIAAGNAHACLIYSAHPRCQRVSSLNFVDPRSNQPFLAASYAAWGHHHLAVLSQDGRILWYA